MNILFLHPNFPAQFKSPCLELAKYKHHIKFICQTHYGRSIRGVEKLVLKGRGSHENTLLSSKNEHNRTLFRGKIYRESFLILKDAGWNPDVAIAHSGWGCGIHIKEIWPKTHFISYLEWWFDAESDLVDKLSKSKYFDFSINSSSKLLIRNMPAAYEMCVANQIIAPTEWQKNQLPRLLRENCQVVQDQIDSNIFFPEPEKISDFPVLTYGTRGMEPMRGFPQFIQILPQLLQKWPQLTVEIAGTDTVSYGGKLPKEKSWKKWALNFLNQEGIANRVKWLGTMPLAEYANWLKQTWCHVYFSEPYVTSWSLIEALYCQIPMVISDNKLVDEFSQLSANIIKADHNNKAEVVEAISKKIRFAAISTPVMANTARATQTKSVIFAKTHTTTLATLIADVEAATKV